MRTDGILHELNKRIEEQERIADQCWYVEEERVHLYATKVLKQIITLIESYEMSGMEDDDDHLILGRVDYDGPPTDKET